MIAIALIVGVAFASTLLWSGAAYFYIATRFGVPGLSPLEPGAMPMVVTAAVAPVVIIWLAAGFLGVLMTLRYQGQAIRQVLWQMKRTAEHTDAMARLLLEQRRQSRGEAFFLTFQDLRDEMNGALASLAAKAGMCSPQLLPTLWSRYDCGERSVFCHLFRDRVERDEGFILVLGRMAAADSRMRADALFFLARFERLLRLGAEWDEQRFILDLAQDGDLGFVQKVVFKAVNGASAAPTPSQSQSQSQSPPPPPSEVADQREDADDQREDADADAERPVRVWPKGFPPKDALLEDALHDQAVLKEALAEINSMETGKR